MTKCSYWIISILMVYAIGSGLAAAGDWSIVRQADWPTHFRDIAYTDAQHAWAVGDFGVIAATSDGGKSWTPQRSGVKQNLQRVMFVDAKTGWAVGDDGTVLHTSDGGNTWQTQEIGTTADMTAVYFVDTKTGWVAGNSPTVLGSSGAIYHTTDGGATWKTQTVAELAEHDLGLYDIYFINATTGWAAGGRQASVHGPGQAAILFTQDGGKIWTLQDADLQNPLFSVYFGDKDTGWTFGLGAMWETQDGGKTWESMLPPPDEEAGPGEGGFGRRRLRGLRSGTFAGTTKLWGIDLMGRLVHLADDGKSMVPVAVPAGSLSDIAFVSPDAGCAVGEYGAILTTDDGGQSWTVRARIKADILRSIAPASAENIWCVGPDGVVCQSSDGGQTWSPVDIGVEADFQDVSFADASNGWILARIAPQGGRRGGEFGGGGEVTGVILKTSDGGKTWSEQVRGPEYPVASISVVDSQNAYMCGSGGIAFGTTDGGGQWTQQDTQVAWDIADIAFVNAMTGWAVGWTGLAIRTNDGGATWTRLTTYTSYDLNGVYFVNDKKGWAVGNYGIILTTDDGGDTWHTQRCYSYSNLNEVYFADASRGWIVGDSGTIFVTADGGKTWDALSLPTRANLYDIKKAADGSLWVTGEWGTVIKGEV